MVERPNAPIQTANQNAIGHGIQRGAQLRQQAFQLTFRALALTLIGHGDQHRAQTRRHGQGCHAAQDGDQLAVGAEHHRHRFDAIGHHLPGVAPEQVVLWRCRKALDGLAMQLLARQFQEFSCARVGKHDAARSGIHHPHRLLQFVERGVPRGVDGRSTHAPAFAPSGSTARSKK